MLKINYYFLLLVAAFYSNFLYAIDIKTVNLDVAAGLSAIQEISQIKEAAEAQIATEKAPNADTEKTNLRYWLKIYKVPVNGNSIMSDPRSYRNGLRMAINDWRIYASANLSANAPDNSLPPTLKNAIEEFKKTGRSPEDLTKCLTNPNVFDHSAKPIPPAPPVPGAGQGGADPQEIARLKAEIAQLKKEAAGMGDPRIVQVRKDIDNRVESVVATMQSGKDARVIINDIMAETEELGPKGTLDFIDTLFTNLQDPAVPQSRKAALLEIQNKLGESSYPHIKQALAQYEEKQRKVEVETFLQTYKPEYDRLMLLKQSGLEEQAKNRSPLLYLTLCDRRSIFKKFMKSDLEKFVQNNKEFASNNDLKAMYYFMGKDNGALGTSKGIFDRIEQTLNQRASDSTIVPKQLSKPALRPLALENADINPDLLAISTPSQGNGVQGNGATPLNNANAGKNFNAEIEALVNKPNIDKFNDAIKEKLRKLKNDPRDEIEDLCEALNRYINGNGEQAGFLAGIEWRGIQAKLKALGQ